MATLDPKLLALQKRLEAALSDDSLAFDAASLGDDGSAIITLFQSALGKDSVTVSGKVEISASGEYLLVSADALQTPILGIEQGATSTYFGVANDLLSIQLQTNAGTAWTFASSFPQLSATWAGLFHYETDAADSTQAVLASEDVPLIGGPLNVVAGINLKTSLSLSSGPAKSLTTLVEEISSPITMIGPALASPTLESLTTSTDIADFSVTLPIVGTLDFKSSQVSFYALHGTHNGGNLYDAYFQASSLITLGPVSLPLMMRVPYATGRADFTSKGWTFGTLPGRSVPVSDLAAFFAALTGLELLGGLPAAVKALSKFELVDLTLKLNADFSDYSYFGMSFRTPKNNGNRNSWTVIAGSGQEPILELTDLVLTLAVNRTATTPAYSGLIAGTVSLSETLSLQCSIPLPANTGLWRFSAFSQRSLPNLVDFARLLGGRSLADLLPPKLGDLTSFDLESMMLTYNPATNTFKNFFLGMSSSQTWEIVEDWLSIDTLSFLVSVDDPLSPSSALTGEVAGRISLGSSAHIDVQVAKTAPAASWLLTVSTDSVALPSLSDLATLANGDVGPLLPKQLRKNHFTLSDVTISADLSKAQMQALGFTLSTTDTWTVITDILKVTAVGVVLDLSWKNGSRQTKGTIWGDVSFCQADFYLEAAYSEPGWSLQVYLMAGSELTLENLTDAFDTSIWQTLSGLGVPNIAMKSASISYDTASGSYSFAGDVGPADTDQWQIPIGIADIEVESLGAKVTCTREKGGNVSDQKIYVTGAFSVGSIDFTVSYLAGSQLTLDCTLVGNEPLSVKDMVTNLCDKNASTVTWVSGVEALDSMQISDAHAAIVLGDTPTFEVYGKIEIEDVAVDSLFVVREIKGKWEFAFAISIDASWSLAGFTKIFDVFNLDSSTWMIAASSFTDTGFSFPPSFTTPEIAVIERGLDFYASFTTADTLSTISTVEQLLPAGTLAAEYTVHGLLASPLADSYLEVVISSSSDGLPLFGMEQVKLQSLALRLTAEPAFGLRGVFLFDAVKNPDGDALTSGVAVDLMISASDVTLNFGPPPGETYIFNWKEAFGISGLTIELDKVGFTFAWEPIAIGGNIGGQITFEHSDDPVNSVFKNALPDPSSVAYMQARRAALSSEDPERYSYFQDVDYNQPYDQNSIVVAMDTSFVVILAGNVPVPYAKKLAGHFVNMTLPYILDRFADIDLPPMLMPIQFPDLKFYLELPDPEHPGVGSNLVFDLHGKLLIFGLHGETKAHFDATRVMFSGMMDPILVPADGSLISITAEGDQNKGFELYVDSSPPSGKSNISGNFQLDFFGMASFQGDLSLKSASNPIDTKFKFHVEGTAGSLAHMDLTFIYQQASYLSATGDIDLHLTADGLPGFSLTKDGKRFKVADAIDFSKLGGGGLDVTAKVDLELDARDPSKPIFRLTGKVKATLKISQGCQLPVAMDLDIKDVTKDTFAQLPLTLAEQMVANASNVFAGLLSLSPDCYAELLKLGGFVLAETSQVATVLVDGYEMGVTTIDEGASLLHEVDSGAAEVADSLWNIFGSKNSKNNTKAMKDGGYHAVQTGEAIKNTQDKEEPQNPYTANNLVHDQAAAGYQAVHVAAALCSAFTGYESQPVQAGGLLANQQLTSFNPKQVTDALRKQYPKDTATAAEMASLLSQIYTGSSSLSAQQMADALAPLYPAAKVATTLRQHYPDETESAADMAALLMPAYKKAKSPLTVDELAAALAPLYAVTGVAAVLHSDFASETETALELATILKTAYAKTPSPVDASEMADALAPIFTTPSDIVSALKSLYPKQAGTATQLIGILQAAYTGIDLTKVMQALAASGFNALDIAAPAKAAFSSATVEDMGQGLVAAFSGAAALTALPLGTALLTASYDSGDIAKGVKAGLADTSIGLMAAILLIISDSDLSSAVASTQDLSNQGDSMATAAPEVVAAVSGLSGSTLACALGSVYMPPLPSLADLLDACVAAFTTPDANGISEGCLSFLPGTKASQLLSALQAAYTAAGKTLTNAAALAAVQNAFAYIGSPISQGDFGKLYLSLGSSSTPAEVTVAIVSAYGKEATAASLITALQDAYSGSSTLIDARVAATAITPALGFTTTDADQLLSPLAEGFELTTCPNNVGALGVALNCANYSLNAVSAAMSGYWKKSWTPAAYGILASVYSNPAWATAVTERASGKPITTAAPAIYSAYTDTDCTLMVEVLAAVYDLSVAAEAISPMAKALEAVVSDGAQVYTLSDATAAMSAQYSPDWTQQDATQFQQIFSN